MSELFVNKVVIGSTVMTDLTGDTVTPEALREGVTAHDCSGAPITGEAKQKESVFCSGLCYVTMPALKDAKAGGTGA